MVRKCLVALVLSAFATCSGILAVEHPASAPARVKVPVSVPVHYADQAVVISTAGGVAVVRFTGAIPEGRTYVYRFLPAGAAREEKGDGRVFEKYVHKPLPAPGQGDEVVDAGGQLKVTAGKISLTWSLGSRESGWLYYMPEDERVQMVKADAFDKLELSRFALPGAPVAAAAAATTQPVSTTQPTARAADQLDVLEAVFRHQFAHNPSAGQQKVEYYFLSLDQSVDPPAELLARFKGEGPKVLPVSLAESSPREGVKHKDLAGRGLVFRVLSIAWLDEDTAEVRGGTMRASYPRRAIRTR
jgi:hypothetical protein